MNFKLITPKQKYELYLNALVTAARKYQSISISDRNIHDPLVKQQVIYGVKYLINLKYRTKKNKTKEEIEYNFNIVQLVKSCMACLTPKEFVNLFPITKEYDGDKWEVKDYYSTIEVLKEYSVNEPLGDKVDELLWDYQNNDIRFFMLEAMSLMSDIRHLQGKKDFMEEWLEDQGVDTYTVNETDGYIINNTTHKSVPYSKPMPKYLNIVK